MALWKKLLIGIGLFFVAMVVLGLVVGKDGDKDQTVGAEPASTTAAPTAPPTPTETPAAAPPGKTLAGPESRCTSDKPSAPLAIRSTTVKVGKVAGHPGTSATVTIAYDGGVPTTGSVLWSLLANNPDGQMVQLGYKIVDGQRSAYFYFPFSEAQQHNMDGFPDMDSVGEMTMVMPSAAVDALGSTWWWSSVINVDGVDISTCGG